MILESRQLGRQERKGSICRRRVLEQQEGASSWPPVGGRFTEGVGRKASLRVGGAA